MQNTQTRRGAVNALRIQAEAKARIAKQRGTEGVVANAPPAVSEKGEAVAEPGESPTISSSTESDYKPRKREAKEKFIHKDRYKDVTKGGYTRGKNRADITKGPTGYEAPHDIANAKRGVATGAKEVEDGKGSAGVGAHTFKVGS